LLRRSYNDSQNADGKRHFALAMANLDESGAETEVVAVARRFWDEKDRSTGEVAFTTIDDWQGLGIGTALASELARWCYDAGITSWKATFLMENKSIRKVLGAVGECGSEYILCTGLPFLTGLDPFAGTNMRLSYAVLANHRSKDLRARNNLVATHHRTSWFFAV